MGRNFVLNMADHGFAVAVYNRTPEKTKDFMEKEVGARPIQAGYDLQEFVSLLRRPRALILLVAAGDPVDAVLRELLPLLEPGDLIIDSGNSHFTDTNRRGRFLSGKKLNFMGMGISGGEAGARYGPSLMPGGSREMYDRVGPILEAAAARVKGEPCVTYLGPRSAGHYVKMVHNGIEYGLMELIVETYDLFKRGLGLTPAELAPIYDRWNREELNSFLVEITAKIFTRQDDRTGKPLIDMILDKAKQKGTGMWTSWDAMDLQVGTPTIDAAVVMRDMSGYKEERQIASQFLAGPSQTFTGRSAALHRPGEKRPVRRHDRHLRPGPGPAPEGLRHVRLWPGPGGRGPHLAGRLHHPGGPPGRHPHRLQDQSGFAQPPHGPPPGQGIYEPGGGLAGSGKDGRHPGAAGPGPDGDPELLRRLPQRRAAGQPDPGPAGLLRGAYLRAPGRPRRLPHRVGGGVRLQDGTCRGAT